ncbi:MAG TPA: hypothetical protein VN306_10635, partial [Mycobacterium sp.]|nr:hypothetical protein [Mycobacterium sp.]
MAAAADANGNLYIAGSTSSLDFPVASAVQPRAGGSTLFRIDRVSGQSEKLYPAGLSALASIAVDPQNPQMVYATSGNSVWRSTDAGTTWASLSAFPAGVAAWWVVVDPFDSNTLYAATPRQGVFKSVDGGLTWTAANGGILQAGDGTINVGRVWADPKVPHVVFASFTSGLLRSGDGGASWSVVAGSYFFGATLAFDPLSPGTLYVALGMQISKSTDDGQTFAALGTLPDHLLPIALEADPFHAGVLYASTYDGICQSSDAGATWTLKAKGQSTVIAADPKYPNIYANITQYGIVRSSDGFGTSQPVGPPEMWLNQIAIGGQWVFVTAASSTDAFVVKLDSQGNTVYSTYFGGSANDGAVAIAVGNDGSAYVAGTTSSIDFPATAGAYTTSKPGAYGSNFLSKLNPDGSLAWSTYFADSNTTVASVAVDAAGNPHIGGWTGGGLPTTPGAYQTQFQRGRFCTGFIGCFPGPSSAFVTKFSAGGTSLIYSTYVSTDSNKQTVQNAQALVFDSDGNVYLGGSGYLGAAGNVVLLNAAGSALLGSAFQAGVNISAITRDASGSVYATGSVTAVATFLATQGAFQTGPRPPGSGLPAQAGAGGGSDAFVIKWDAGLSHILAATLLGGELVDLGESIAIDPSGNVIVSGATDSKAFPTAAPFQAAFSARTGFVSELDPSLSRLVFSTYLGDERPFDAHAAVPDGSGNILMAGSILGANASFLAGDPGFSYSVASLVVANKIALAPAPAVRLDSVVN